MRRLALTVVLLLGARALAADCDAARLRELTAVIDRETHAARRWTLAWGGAYALLTVSQVAVAPLFSDADRPDWYWGAASTLVGAAFTVIDPLEVVYAGEPFVKRAAAPDADVCALIAEGERIVREGADHERSGRAWWLHGANVALNAVIGLVLGLAYGHWVSGLVNFVIGAAIGEATIFTSATGFLD